ncbi:MAG: glycosyltransferase [Acidobacteriota bacterium]
MRILQLTSSLPLSPSGSNAPFILHIARSLAARGHEIHLVAPYHPKLDWPAREGEISFHFFRYAPLARWCIWGYGQSLQSDVSLKPGVFALLPAAAVAAAVSLRRLQSRSRFDVLHAHWLLPNGPIASLARRGLVPLVVSLHGSDVYVAGKGKAFRFAAKRALRRAAAVVGCSEELVAGARRIYQGERLYHTLPYGVDEELFRPGEGVEASTVTILAAGRLVEKKGFEILLRALGQMASPARLSIAGSGDLRGRLEVVTAELGLGDRVQFLGDLSQPEILKLYRSCAIFCLPSVRDSGGNVDGLPNVLLEAMSSGMAVAASRVGGVPQVMRDGENGLLVDEKQPAALAAALDALAGDVELRRRLGGAARRTILDGFTWRLYAQRFEAILDSVSKS